MTDRRTTRPRQTWLIQDDSTTTAQIESDQRRLARGWMRVIYHRADTQPLPLLPPGDGRTAQRAPTAPVRQARGSGLPMALVLWAALTGLAVGAMWLLHLGARWLTS